MVSSRCSVTACYFFAEEKTGRTHVRVRNNFENDIPIGKLFSEEIGTLGIIGVNYFSQVTPVFFPRNTHSDCAKENFYFHTQSQNEVFWHR